MLLKLRAYLRQDSLGSALAKALAGSAGIRIAGMAFGFLVGVQLARGLGVNGYGVYGLAMSIISIAAIPAEFGLPQLITREAAKAHATRDWSTLRAVLSWAHRTTLVLSLAAMLFSVVVIGARMDQMDRSLVYALCAGFLFIVLAPLGNVCSAALRGMQHIVKGQMPEIIVRPALFSAFLFVGELFTVDAMSPQMAMGLQVFAAACSAALAYGLLKRILPAGNESQISSKKKSEWFRTAMPMAMTEAMRVVQGNISILALGAFTASSVVGVFRAGSSMCALLTFPLSLTHIVLAPFFARLFATSEKEKLQQLSGFASMAMVAGVSLLTLPFIFFGETLFGRMFGHEFEGANSTLLILSFGAALGSVFGPATTLLNMTGHEKQVARGFGLSLAVLCVLIIPLVMIFGAEGAAIASSTSFCAWSFAMWRASRELLNVDTSIAAIFRHSRRT